MAHMQHGRRGTDGATPERATDASEPRSRTRRPVSPLTVLGVVLVAAGLACLGWVGWQYVGTTIVAKQDAAKEITVLQESWGQPTTDPAPEATPEPPVPGSSQWLMRIPAFGSDWVWPVVAGVDVADLQRGIGWYPDTTQPGQVGNFAVAGHRITHGEPFRRMLELDIGDTIVIESRDTTWTYELTSAPGALTVQDTETWVLDPVPGHDDVPPAEALITLTTCEDLFHSPDRSVAFGKLISTETK